MALRSRPASLMDMTEEEEWPTAGFVEQLTQEQPEQTVSCSRCNQKLTIKENQLQYGCPACRGVFDTASFRLVSELPPDPKAPIWRSF